MELIINPYQDPCLGIDWHEQSPVLLKEVDEFLQTGKDGFEFSSVETNHGTAADWPTITITVTGALGVFFVVPEVHKKIREAFEEWQRIGYELKSLIAWLASKYPMASYPKELLFFDLLEWFESELGIDASELEFISLDDQFPIPDARYGSDIDRAFLFTLKSGNTIHQVAIKNNRNVIWKHSYDIKT